MSPGGFMMLATTAVSTAESNLSRTRFTRVDAGTLLYRFTVEDPDTWDRPWSGEYAWPATDKPIYEYACHEGNYALGDILRGARREEAEQAAAKAKH